MGKSRGIPVINIVMAPAVEVTKIREYKKPCSDCGNKGIIAGEGEEMEGGDGKEGSESLRVNAGKTKVMWCRVSKGQVEHSGDHPCGVCRELVAIQSYAKSILGCMQGCLNVCSMMSQTLNDDGDMQPLKIRFFASRNTEPNSH